MMQMNGLGFIPAEKKPERLMIEQLYGGKRRIKHQDIIHLRKLHCSNL